MYLIEICKRYPQKPEFQEILFYKNFFLSLTNVLPKGYYRDTYTIYLRTRPIDEYLASRDQLCAWIKSLLIGDNTVTEHFSNETGGGIGISIAVLMLVVSVAWYYKMT
jgi:hypothetical protein